MRGLLIPVFSVLYFFLCFENSGLWGVLPIHPKTFIRARCSREEKTKLKTNAGSSQLSSSEVESKEEARKEEVHPVVVREEKERLSEQPDNH